MSIPAHVVLGGDLDTLGRLRSGRFDDPFMPSMDRPFGAGVYLYVPRFKNFGTVEYVAPMDMELHRIHFNVENPDVKDVWSAYINKDTEANYIIKDFRQKNFKEGLQLMSIFKLKKGDKIVFKLVSADNQRGRKSTISLAFLVSSKEMNVNG